MSNAEMARQLHSINRQQHRLYRAMQEAEQAKPKTKKVINYPRAFFALNVVLGISFIVTNAVAKLAWLMR